MKRSLVTALGLAFGASLLLGCGAADEEGEGAQFPEPIGYDQAMQAHPGATQTASMSTPTEQPAPAPSLAPGEVPGSTSEAQATASVQPQAGDVVVGADANEYADTDPSALTDFRTALDPYGAWVDDGTYGTVWVPSQSVVGSDFAPYVSAGHWAYDDDWTWVSDYDWGWAPFHYGRWVYIGARGWSWIPGRTYAGAWVSWRYGYDDWGYVGWAPMPPTWYWYGGVAVGLAVVPRAPYVFCGYNDVFYPRVATRIVTGSQVGVVASHTRPYVPAQPAVGGSGRVAAHPTVGGPPPSSIGIKQAVVTRSPANDRGLLHAQQFAHASTAQQLGARPPVQSFAGSRIAAASPAGTRAFAAPSRGLGVSSAYGAYGHGAVATAPRYQGIAPTPYRPSYGSYGAYGARPPVRSFSGGYGSSYGGSAFRSYPGGYAAPHYGSMGSSFGSHTFGGGYGGFHPGVPTTSGSHPSYSGDSFTAPHASGGYRGGGGGFHGGGGGVVRGGGGGRR